MWPHTEPEGVLMDPAPGPGERTWPWCPVWGEVREGRVDPRWPQGCRRPRSSMLHRLVAWSGLHSSWGEGEAQGLPGAPPPRGSAVAVPSRLGRGCRRPRPRRGTRCGICALAGSRGFLAPRPSLEPTKLPGSGCAVLREPPGACLGLVPNVSCVRVVACVLKPPSAPTTWRPGSAPGGSLSFQLPLLELAACAPGPSRPRGRRGTSTGVPSSLPHTPPPPTSRLAILPFLSPGPGGPWRPGRSRGTVWDSRGGGRRQHTLPA